MIVIGADTYKGSHALAAVDEGTGRYAVAGRSRLTMRDMWLLFGGLAAWMRSGCGRSRTAGMSHVGWSRRC